ncbi:DUF397 domain-containing protein [Streptomyces sp. NPDC059569]|uniref:DUF397 domain-containing protein n=1 Tax=Streptomyces sp. NPDC059569 TaxID=3346869 RepID=UPI0036B15401
MKPYIESPSAAGLEWVKSSYSGNNGNCVEVAVPFGGGRAVRDSKNPGGPALLFSADEWQAFVRGAADGEFH